MTKINQDWLEKTKVNIMKDDLICLKMIKTFDLIKPNKLLPNPGKSDQNNLQRPNPTQTG